jgi:2-hydroxy-6-oxonona-2,4-dienedioate hydrolase
MALTEEAIIEVPGMLSRWVRLANGARAHYMTSGESGPAVILLHGGIVGSSGTAGWRFMAPFLGQNGFRVYCPDQPAFGWADTRPEHFPTRGLQSYVEFIDMFADALCLDRFHLSGNSMGCSHTVYYTINHPERVISFALIAGGVGPLVDPSKRVSGISIGQFEGTPESMRALMEPIIYRKVAIDPDLLEMRTQAALRQAESQKARGAAMRELQNDPNYQQWIDTRGRFDKINVPGIYLYGKDDVLSPVENGYHQEDVLPSIQFFYPEECGHQGQTDQPEMFNQVFLEFFRDGKVSRRTADWAGVSKRRPELPNLVEQAVAAGV